jgi:hypothetical protein
MAVRHSGEQNPMDEMLNKCQHQAGSTQFASNYRQ